MILLSYPLNADIPMFNNQGHPRLIQTRCLAKGDSCNQSWLSMSVHSGTHVDAPSHFSAHGKTVTSLDSAFWFSDNIGTLCLDERPPPGTLLGPTYFENASILGAIDPEILLLKTGYGFKRAEELYWKSAPALTAEVADFLREEFPRLRILGFDLLSLTSLAHRDEGRRAHRAFLDHDRPIVLIEDMCLAPLRPNFCVRNLLISPLFLEGAEGAPCTVWGNIGV